MNAVANENTLSVETIQAQIEALQQQKAEQLAKEKAKAKQSVQEANKAITIASQQRAVKRARTLWPNGAILLERMYELYHQKEQAREDHESIALRLKAKYDGLSESSRPTARDTMELAKLEEAEAEAASKIRALDTQYVAANTFDVAFRTDHTKEIASLVKALETVLQQAEALAKKEKVMNDSPRFTNWGNHVQEVAGQIPSLIDKLKKLQS